VEVPALPGARPATTETLELNYHSEMVEEFGFGLPTQDSGPSPVLQLPAPPGSGAMALSGVLTLGTFGLLRSARQIHLGSVPEWYHLGGPSQIGHAHPIDLNSQSLSLCWYDSETCASRYKPAVDRQVAGDVCLGSRSQHGFTPRAPRAPPFNFLEA